MTPHTSGTFTPPDYGFYYDGTVSGAINCVATDELCCSLQLKTAGRRIDDTTGGNSGVEPRVALMYTHMVEKRGYSLNDFVGLVSSNTMSASEPTARAPLRGYSPMIFAALVETSPTKSLRL